MMIAIQKKKKKKKKKKISKFKDGRGQKWV